MPPVTVDVRAQYGAAGHATDDDALRVVAWLHQAVSESVACFVDENNGSSSAYSRICLVVADAADGTLWLAEYWGDVVDGGSDDDRYGTWFDWERVVPAVRPLGLDACRCRCPDDIYHMVAAHDDIAWMLSIHLCDPADDLQRALSSLTWHTEPLHDAVRALTLHVLNRAMVESDEAASAHDEKNASYYVCRESPIG